MGKRGRRGAEEIQRLVEFLTKGEVRKRRRKRGDGFVEGVAEGEVPEGGGKGEIEGMVEKVVKREVGEVGRKKIVFFHSSQSAGVVTLE